MSDIKAEFLFDITADLDREGTIDVGTTPHGTRRIVYVKGGLFTTDNKGPFCMIGRSPTARNAVFNAICGCRRWPNCIHDSAFASLFSKHYNTSHSHQIQSFTVPRDCARKRAGDM